MAKCHLGIHSAQRYFLGCHGSVRAVSMGRGATLSRTIDLLITRGLILSGSDRYQQLGLYVGAFGPLRSAWFATVGEHSGEPVVHFGWLGTHLRMIRSAAVGVVVPEAERLRRG